MSHAAEAHEKLSALIGVDPGPGEWFVVDQERIDAFADATLDHQFIHVDVERATNETPFGGTIAHGFLTLSLMVHLVTSVPADMPRLDGVVMGINYGLNKVRFLNPVPAGARVRARLVISSVDLKGSAVDMTRTVTVELEGSDKPALVAEWIGRTVFDS
jgi:acyl dehydratase